MERSFIETCAAYDPATGTVEHYLSDEDNEITGDFDQVLGCLAYDVREEAKEGTGLVPIRELYEAGALVAVVALETGDDTAKEAINGHYNGIVRWAAWWGAEE